MNRNLSSGLACNYHSFYAVISYNKSNTSYVVNGQNETDSSTFTFVIDSWPNDVLLKLGDKPQSKYLVSRR